MERRTPGVDFLHGLFHWNIRAGINPNALRARPVDRVIDDALHHGLVIGRIGFVARPKIENLAVPAFEGATAAKRFAPLEPRENYDFVGIWNRKWFAVHFFLLQLEIFINALRDGVAGITNPETFLLTGFPPGQAARGSQQAFEDLGVVPGMQHDQSHAL